MSPAWRCLLLLALLPLVSACHSAAAYAGVTSDAANAPPWPDAGMELTVDERLVRVLEVIPDAVEDMRYATDDNFMKRRVYPEHSPCLLRESVAKMLATVATDLRAKGFRLRLYDCYRPLAIQRELWKILPKPGYVANPAFGSNHNRGASIDLSLVTLEGDDVEMPTPYDTFSSAAHHAYPGGTAVSRRNRDTLREAMEAVGFRKNRMEWWHYDAPRPRRFALMDQPLR